MNETGLEKAIKKLRQIKEEKLLCKIVKRIITNKEKLNEVRNKILIALDEGKDYFLVNNSDELKLAEFFLKEIKMKNLITYTHKVYIDEKGLKKLDKKLKKLNMGGL